MMNASQLLLVLSLVVSAGYAMTVEEAYKDIPHGRTVFVPQQATMPEAERRALVSLFEAVDVAIVAKANVRHRMDVDEAYKPFWEAWRNVKVPKKLDPVRKLIEEAVKEEQSYLSKRDTQFDRNNPHVIKASQSLHQAYSLLLQLYPNENATNKQAFFDYLCALDFI